MAMRVREVIIISLACLYTQSAHAGGNGAQSFMTGFLSAATKSNYHAACVSKYGEEACNQAEAEQARQQEQQRQNELLSQQAQYEFQEEIDKENRKKQEYETYVQQQLQQDQKGR